MSRTPREVGKQVQETLNEQVRDLPIHAARLAMFGVGRALLLTDRVTKDVRSVRDRDFGPVLDRLFADAEKLTTRLEGTRVGRVLEKVVPKPAQPPAPTPVAEPPAEISLGKPKAADEPADPAPSVPAQPAPALQEELEPVPGVDAGPAAETAVLDSVPEPGDPGVPDVEPDVELIAVVVPADLPVPNYDELSHASLRARLRKLTAAEVTVLRDYEAATLARPEIVRMYDNRLAKLATQP
ncbi:hypothetical protein LO762_01630 [Actinocorallia sp. API 0066]|uniref:hypothetical protein n=1 Tax=Actinocorallia sp. API 0066 TaxID=2896846 RepID=UPI001E36EC64|nr:hypothetical protein [Actinocorallia sp. API 0066]MCD0447901.1 hypothetical protein [Actinocorallia sp. API 0066]